MYKENRRLVVYSIVWFLLSCCFAFLLSGPSETTQSILVLLTTISYLLSVYCWCKSGCRFISVYVFFLAYSYLCNCAQSLLHVFGVPVDFLTSYWNLPFEGVSYMLRFQLICISALNIGACLAVKEKKSCVSTACMQENFSNSYNNIHKDDKKLLLLMLFFLCGTFWAAMEVARVRSTMSYHDWMYGGYQKVDTKFYFSYFYAFLSLRFVFCKRYIWLIYLSWLYFIVLFMMLGLRTQAIPYVSFFIITLPVTHGWVFKKKYLPLWTLGVFVFIILLGVISSTRNQESVDLSQANTEGGMAVSFYVALADVGASAETIGIAMEQCDKGLPHYQSILYSIITVVPKRVLKLPEELFQWPDWEILSSPGAFMSRKIGMAGLGFSFMAEAYLNYGWFGWIFILIYGFFIAKMENMAYKDIMQGNFFKITYLLYLARQVFFARADFCLGENYIEYMIFTAIIYKIFQSKEKLFSLNKNYQLSLKDNR